MVATFMASFCFIESFEMKCDRINKIIVAIEKPLSLNSSGWDRIWQTCKTFKNLIKDNNLIIHFEENG